MKTVRISRGLDETLRSEASEKAVSVNSLINDELVGYVEWRRHAEKLSFISINPEVLRRLIESVDKVNLLKIGKELGAKLTRESMMFIFQDTNPRAFVSYVRLICKYTNMFEYEIRNEGSDFTLVARHSLGENFSTFIAEYLKEAARGLFGIKPVLKTYSNSIVARFPLPAGKGWVAQKTQESAVPRPREPSKQRGAP